MRRGQLLMMVAVMLSACTVVRRGPEALPRPATRRAPPPRVAVPPRPAVAVAPRRTTPRRARTALACLEHPRIDAWERRLRQDRVHRRSVRQVLARGRRYLPRLRSVVSDIGLPKSIALLPAIESSFRPLARGRWGDMGLWQLRAPTARRFGLVVDGRRDDRFHPIRATRGAARYLRVLHRRYRDWPLALAAYNAGEGRVDRARRALPGADFWELAEQGYLPRTSREFVPRFLALVRVQEGREACGPPDVPTLQARND